MQTIVLKENQSDHFELIQYPDGQKSIKLYLDKLDIKQPVIIKCRIKTFAELEVLGCLIAALRKNDYSVYELQFVYLFGVRSDRAFSIGEPNYFRDVLAPIINGYNVPLVELLWPFEPLPFKNKFLINGKTIRTGNWNLNNMLVRNSGVFTYPDYFIAGDSSAVGMNLYGLFAPTFGMPSFKKTRISDEINLELSDEDKQSILKWFGGLKNAMESGCTQNFGKLFIIDDLCDGGATFIAAAKCLKEIMPEIKLNLFIYHGLFTKGTEELLQHYDNIYCTNSYQDIVDPTRRIQQIKVI